MAWTLVDSVGVGFTDGATGHVFTAPAGAPLAGDLDVLIVNSDTTVSTPPGYTLPPGGSQVGNQGAYLFYRFALGTEPATTTITTNGNHNTSLTYYRWRGGNAIDVATSVILAPGNNVSATAATTGPLAGAGELAIMAAAQHNLNGGAIPSAPVYPGGYTAGPGTSQGGANLAATNQFTCYKTTAGPAAELPTLTWTTGCQDVTALMIVFKPTAGGGPVTLGGRPGGLRLGGHAATIVTSAGVADPQFLGPMTNLLTCLGQEVARTPRGAVKHQRITPGEVVVAAIAPNGVNECCEGIASVRLVRFHPTDHFPSEAMRAATEGGVTSWAVEVELHVIRCGKQPGPMQAPTDAALTSDGTDLLADWAACRRAVCCLYDAGLVLDYVIGNGTPTQAEGGCMGVTLMATLQVECAECADGIN